MSWPYDETFDLHFSTKESEFGVFLQNFQNASQINTLTPNDHYSGRAAPLTSKVAIYIFIQQI